MRKYKKFFATIALILLATVIFCPVVQAFAAGGSGGAAEETHTGIFSGPWIDNSALYWEKIEVVAKPGTKTGKTTLSESELVLLTAGGNYIKYIPVLKALEDINVAWGELDKASDGELHTDDDVLFADGDGISDRRMASEVHLARELCENTDRLLNNGDPNALSNILDILQDFKAADRSALKTLDENAISEDLLDVIKEYIFSSEYDNQIEDAAEEMGGRSGSAFKNLKTARIALADALGIRVGSDGIIDYDSIDWDPDNNGSVGHKFAAIQNWFNDVYKYRTVLQSSLSKMGDEYSVGSHSTYTEEPEAVERGIAALIRSLADGLSEILSDMGVTLNNVIFGRIKTVSVGGLNVSVNNFFMEFDTGNVYGIIGAFVYSLLRGIFALSLLVAAMYFLAKASLSNSAKAIETMKENLGYVVIAILLLVAMPNIIDLFIKIKELILYEVDKGFSVALSGSSGGTSGLAEMYAAAARADRTFLSAAEYLGVTVISIYFAFAYVSAACSATLVFAFFPFFVLVSFKDRKVLSTWLFYMLGIVVTPIIDAILLYIPIIADSLGAPPFVRLIMCMAVIPTRSLIKKLLGFSNSVGAEMLGVGAMMAAGRAMGTMARTGKDIIGGVTSTASAVAGDMASARTFKQLDTLESGAEKIEKSDAGRNATVMSSLSAEAGDRNSPISNGLGALNSAGGLGRSSGGLSGLRSSGELSDADAYRQKGINKLATLGNFESPLMSAVSNERKAQLYRQRAVKNLASGAAKTAGRLAGGNIGTAVGIAGSSFLGPNAMVAASAAGLGFGSEVGGAVSGAAVDAGWSVAGAIKQHKVSKELAAGPVVTPYADNADYSNFYKEHDGSARDMMEYLNSEDGAKEIVNGLNKYAGDEDSLKEGILKYADIIGHGYGEKPGTGYVTMSSMAGRAFANKVRSVINTKGGSYENLSKALQDTGFLKEYRDDVTKEKLVQLNSTENGFAVGAQFDRCYQYRKSKAEFEKFINKEKKDGSQLANVLGGKGEGDPDYQKYFAAYLSRKTNDRARAMFEASKGKEYVNKYLKDGKETAQYSKDFAEFKKTRHIYNDVTSPVRMGRGREAAQVYAQKEKSAVEAAVTKAETETRQAEATPEVDPNKMVFKSEEEVAAKKAAQKESLDRLNNEMTGAIKNVNFENIVNMYEREIAAASDQKEKDKLREEMGTLLNCKQ